MEIDKARLGRVLALAVAQLAGIRDQGTHIHQALVIVEGDFLLLRVHFETVRVDAGVVANAGGNRIAAHDGGGSDTRADGRTLGDAQAARPGCQFALVGRLYGNIAAFNDPGVRGSVAQDVHRRAGL